jgi:hypothetical protein
VVEAAQAAQSTLSRSIRHTAFRQPVGFRNILWRSAGAGLAAVDICGGVIDTPLQVQAPS